jgi:hypothetical protein
LFSYDVDTVRNGIALDLVAMEGKRRWWGNICTLRIRPPRPSWEFLGQVNTKHRYLKTVQIATMHSYLWHQFNATVTTTRSENSIPCVEGNLSLLRFMCLIALRDFVFVKKRYLNSREKKSDIWGWAIGSDFPSDRRSVTDKEWYLLRESINHVMQTYDCEPVQWNDDTRAKRASNNSCHKSFFLSFTYKVFPTIDLKHCNGSKTPLVVGVASRNRNAEICYHSHLHFGGDRESISFLWD